MSKKSATWILTILCTLLLFATYREPSLQAEEELDQFIYFPVLLFEFDSSVPTPTPKPLPPPPDTPVPTATSVPATATATCGPAPTATSTSDFRPTSIEKELYNDPETI